MTTPASNEPDTGYARLEGQIRWYDRKSGSAQQYYKATKIFVIAASASLSIVSLLGHPLFAAVLGALIAMSEGLQHLNQWHHNWITYRSTCEALRHEKYAYLERAEPYEDLEEVEARKLLVSRVESLISTEHSKWIATHERAGAPRAAKGPTGPARV
jgi:hypothetical protein